MTGTVLAADRRIGEILESIRRTFAAKGFDGASMQDLARAADMSVGNFYRYFPSKAAIIDAIISRDLDEIEQNFAVILDSPDPLEALRATLRFRVCEEVCVEDGPMMAEITAVAMRKPEIGDVMARMETVIVHYLLSVFAQITGRPMADVSHRFTAHAGLILMLVKASVMTKSRAELAQNDLAALVLRTIDGVLDEVSAARVKGNT